MKKDKKSTVDQYKQVLKQNQYRESRSKVKQFEKASKNFDRLIEKGLAKKKGYNLMTIEKAHLPNFKIR